MESNPVSSSPSPLRPFGSPKYMSPVNSRITNTSNPCSEISARKVDNDDNAGCNVAGRILQNKSKCPRNPSKAQRSGCSVGGKFAHFGPPTEPNKMASAC